MSEPHDSAPPETPGGLRVTRSWESDRLVLVIQGVIVLSVVIAYEIVRRAGVRMEQRRVAAELAAAPTPSPEKEGATA